MRRANDSQCWSTVLYFRSCGKVEMQRCGKGAKRNTKDPVAYQKHQMVGFPRSVDNSGNSIMKWTERQKS